MCIYTCIHTPNPPMNPGEIKLHYHYNTVRAPLPLRFHLLPEEHPCTSRIVHKGLKGYPMKTLNLTVAKSTTPTISSSHVILLVLITQITPKKKKKWACEGYLKKII